MSLAREYPLASAAHGGAAVPDAALVYAEDLRVRAHRALLLQVRKAQQLALRNRREEAAAHFRSLLEDHPGEPALWSALATVAAEGGAEKVACLERAVHLRPAFAPYQVQLGEACMAVGRMAEARACLERADRLAPGDAHTRLMLCVVALAGGELQEALGHLRPAIAAAVRELALRGRAAGDGLLAAAGACRDVAGASRPRSWNAARLRRRGERQMAHRRWRDAEDSLRSALEVDPRDAVAAMLLARALNRQERYLGAREVLSGFVEAEDVSDDHELLARILVELGHAHLRAQEFDMALQHLETALFVRPSNVDARRQLGWVLLRLDRQAEAMACFEKCREEAGDAGVDAMFGLASVHKSLGAKQETLRLSHAILAADPCHASALALLVKTAPEQRGPENLARARRIADDGSLTRERRIQAHFAAARILDHMDQPDEAFAHYLAGNALKDVTYDRARRAASAATVIAAASPAALAQRSDWGDPSRRPVFIVGMPRSGSTLVEQILSSHPQVHGGGELPLVPTFISGLATIGGRAEADLVPLLDREETGALARHYLGRLDRLNPAAARVTDKMLFNFWHLGHLATAFPHATFLHATRNPMDCCTSIFFHDFAGVHSYAYDLSNIAHYYNLYRQLMRHWQAVLPGRLIEVSYEKLVADGEGEMKRIVAACGLAWDDRCARFHANDRAVNTSSDLQVRQPLYRSAVDRWRRYEAHLDDLRRALDS